MPSMDYAITHSYKSELNEKKTEGKMSEQVIEMCHEDWLTLCEEKLTRKTK